MAFSSILGSSTYLNEEIQDSGVGRDTSAAVLLLEMKQGDNPVMKRRWSTLTAKPVNFCVKTVKFLKSPTQGLKSGIVS